MGKQYPLFRVAWWDGKCEDSKKVKLVAVREFRNNGILENYEKYEGAKLNAPLQT
jgi:hypothetical protein